MGIFLITGVSGGIGMALARRLVDEGHQVIGLVRPSWTGPDLGLARTLVADLAAPDTLAAAVATFAPAIDRLDGLVHCAGTVRPAALAETSVADLSVQFTVNVVAAAELTRLLLPALLAANATVVFINSGSGLAVRPPLVGYGMSKYALRAYADGLRQEQPGLRVCTVYPGRTATPMQQMVRAAENGRYQQEDYVQPATLAAVIASTLLLPPDAAVTDVTVRPSGRSSDRL